jgi:hypothetical protein
MNKHVWRVMKRQTPEHMWHEDSLLFLSSVARSKLSTSSFQDMHMSSEMSNDKIQAFMPVSQSAYWLINGQLRTCQSGCRVLQRRN